MITCVPVGGLANRMRCMASAYEFARCNALPLRFVWFKDSGMNCRFDRLFRPFDLSLGNVSLKEAGLADLLRYDRPRRRNLYLPRLSQKLHFSRCIYEEEVARMVGAPGRSAFAAHSPLAANKEIYIAAYSVLCDYPDEWLRLLFRPQEAVCRKAHRVVAQFAPCTIGIHIRRTDNTQSAALSPTLLFEEQMERRIAEQPDVCFYVASDSPEEKERLAARFPGHVLVHSFSARRDSPQGIEDACAEMWVLAHTREIWGSYWSSYSEIAARWGGIPCTLLKKR